MKSKIIAFVLATLFIQTTFAIAANSNINVFCPDVSVLQTIALENVKYDGRWTGTSIVFPYKQLNWNFYISSLLDTKDPIKARNELGKKIARLIQASGPHHDDSNPRADSWWCSYEHKDDPRTSGIAVSIPV